MGLRITYIRPKGSKLPITRADVNIISIINLQSSTNMPNRTYNSRVALPNVNASIAKRVTFTKINTADVPATRTVNSSTTFLSLS